MFQDDERHKTHTVHDSLADREQAIAAIVRAVIVLHNDETGRNTGGTVPVDQKMRTTYRVLE